MNPNILATKLAATRAKLAKLEAEAAKLRNRELALLPQKLGFADVSALIEALKALGQGKAKTAPAKATADTAASTKPRKRGKVTDETRAELKKMVEAGKTGLEIAKALKVSLPTVQNIKKALGLVRAAKKAAAPTAKKEAAPAAKKPGPKAKAPDAKPAK